MSRFRLAALALALPLAACSRGQQQNVAPDAHVAATDSWLRGLSDADCPRSACLFAVLVDTAGNPIVNADVELTGSAVHVTSNGRGRVIMQAIPLGSRRVRVTRNGETLESQPIAFGYTIQALVMEVAPGSLRIRS
jgi:hypothetical protein